MMILAVYCKKGAERMWTAFRHCVFGTRKDRDMPDHLTSDKSSKNGSAHR